MGPGGLRRLRREGDHLSGLRIHLELPGSVARGDEIRGSLVVENQGEERLELVAPFAPAATNLLVFDHLWNPVAPQPRAKVNVAHEPLALGPGESATFELAGLTYVSGSAQMGFDLAPGRYVVLALYHPGTERLPENSSYPVVVVSNLVAVVVS